MRILSISGWWSWRRQSGWLDWHPLVYNQQLSTGATHVNVRGASRRGHGHAGSRGGVCLTQHEQKQTACGLTGTQMYAQVFHNPGVKAEINSDDCLQILPAVCGQWDLAEDCWQNQHVCWPDHHWGKRWLLFIFFIESIFFIDLISKSILYG